MHHNTDISLLVNNMGLRKFIKTTIRELFELSFENYTGVAPLIEDDIISEYDDFVNRCNIDIEFRKKWLGITIK